MNRRQHRKPPTAVRASAPSPEPNEHSPEDAALAFLEKKRTELEQLHSPTWKPTTHNGKELPSLIKGLSGRDRYEGIRNQVRLEILEEISVTQPKLAGSQEWFVSECREQCGGGFWRDFRERWPAFYGLAVWMGSERPLDFSRPIARGQFCQKVTDEVRKIRNMYRASGMSVAEIQNAHPEWVIWRVRESLREEDRETFNHPNRWGPPVGYATGILSKTQDASPHTINSWMKAYRKSQRSKKL